MFEEAKKDFGGARWQAKRGLTCGDEGTESKREKTLRKRAEFLAQKAHAAIIHSPHWGSTVERVAVVRLGAAPVDIKPLRGFQVALKARLPQRRHRPPALLHRYTGEGGGGAVVPWVVCSRESGPEVALLEPSFHPRRQHTVVAQHA